jgi:uncharacterized protein YkwD
MRDILAGMLLLVCAACESTPPPPDPVTQIPALEGRIFEIVNEERHVIDPRAKDLALDSELVEVARQRSVDMAAHNGFADGSGDPHISATRLMAEDAKFQGLLGENVAAERYAKATGIDVDQCAQAIVGTWLASPSHKENLSFGDYTLTGVGVAMSSDTIYVTQLFATEMTVKASSKVPEVRSFPSAAAAKADGRGSDPALRGAFGSH